MAFKSRAGIIAALLTLMVGLQAAAATAHAAPARPKIALVTSLDGLGELQRLRSQVANLSTLQKIPGKLVTWLAKGPMLSYLTKTEADFRAAFEGTGYELEVVHFADQNSLYQMLHSPEYRAIYWVSHEAPVSSGAGVSSGGAFDADGFEFTPVLGQIHPNLKILALVGCKSYPLVEKLTREMHERGEGQGLKIYGYADKVDGRQGLRASIRVTRPALERDLHLEPTAACRKRSEGMPLRVERQCSIAGPSVRIMAGGRVAAVLARCEAGEKQVQHVFVEPRQPGAALTKADLKITVTSGTNAYAIGDPRALGEFSLHRYGSAATDSDWNLFRLANGEAIGVTSRVFRYVGQLPDAWSMQSFQPFRCGEQ